MTTPVVSGVPGPTWKGFCLCREPHRCWWGSVQLCSQGQTLSPELLKPEMSEITESLSTSTVIPASVHGVLS